MTRERLTSERRAKRRHIFKHTGQWKMRRDNSGDAEEQIARVAEFGYLPERLLSASKRRVARARDRRHKDFVCGIFTGMNQSNVRLNEQHVATRNLPDIGIAGIDFEARHESKVWVCADGSGESAASGKYLQRPPRRAGIALPPNPECSHRGRHVD